MHVPVNFTFSAPVEDRGGTARAAGFPAPRGRGGGGRGGGGGGSQALARAGSPLSTRSGSAGSGGASDEEGAGDSPRATSRAQVSGGAGGAARWAGAAGGGGGGRFGIKSEEEFPGLMPSASDKQKGSKNKKGTAGAAADWSSVAER